MNEEGYARRFSEIHGFTEEFAVEWKHLSSSIGVYFSCSGANRPREEFSSSDFRSDDFGQGRSSFNFFVRGVSFFLRSHGTRVQNNNGEVDLKSKMVSTMKEEWWGDLGCGGTVFRGIVTRY